RAAASLSACRGTAPWRASRNSTEARRNARRPLQKPPGIAKIALVTARLSDGPLVCPACPDPDERTKVPEQLLFEKFLPDDAATAAFGTELATLLHPGDVVRLEGDLGAGKTALARAIIRALAADPKLEVPSPTF